MVKNSTSVCDKDCFNCPFDDCILDTLDSEDYRELAAIDRAIFSTPGKDKLAAQQRAYREANKDKLAAQQRAYREANKDKVAAQQRAWYQANKDKVAAQHRAWYQANKDKVAAQQRAYYQANKDKLAKRKRRKEELMNSDERAVRKAAFDQYGRSMVDTIQRVEPGA